MGFSRIAEHRRVAMAVQEIVLQPRVILNMVINVASLNSCKKEYDYVHAAAQHSTQDVIHSLMMNHTNACPAKPRCISGFVSLCLCWCLDVHFQLTT